jgi:hypothetical protein
MNRFDCHGEYGTAIQIRDLDVDSVLTISATTVLDLVRVGTQEDNEQGQAPIAATASAAAPRRPSRSPTSGQ